MDLLIKRLEKLERLIISQGINNKEVLNLQETCLYLELSKSHIKKLISAESIPHYKPYGKKLYFKRSELNAWLLRNPQPIKNEDNLKADQSKNRKYYFKKTLKYIAKVVDISWIIFRWLGEKL